MMISQLDPRLYKLSVLAHRTARHINWAVKSRQYSTKLYKDKLDNLVKKQSSVLLRKLGDADMQLQVNKVTNLKIAVSKIDGIIIEPHEYFSFWKNVGTTTRKKGYKDGIILVFDKFESGPGGGICQLANLIYWLTLHSELQVVERHHHGYDVFPDSGRVLPFGTGATVFYNYVDLVLYNPTNKRFQFNFSFTDELIKGELRSNEPEEISYKIKEKDHKFIYRESEKQYYRSNKIFRLTIDKKTGNKLSEEHLYSNFCKVSYTPADVNAEIEG